jgi:Glycosyl-4,4'-diaponeurosporenoate acyltransferase
MRSTISPGAIWLQDRNRLSSLSTPQSWPEGLAASAIPSVYATTMSSFANWNCVASNWTSAYIFCYRYMGRAWLWAFVAASLIAFVVPACKLSYLELSSTVTTYRKLRVHWVNHFVQHGSLINHFLRQRYPEYRRTRSRAWTANLLQSTYLQERFHWTVLLFFLLSSLYGISRGYPGWALLITIINVLYNLYPIWSQQYIRVRLNRSRSN